MKIKKPFEETIEHLKKLGLFNSRVGFIFAGAVLLAAIEIFLFPPWLEFWMFLPVILAWGIVYSYKNSKVNREAGE